MRSPENSPPAELIVKQIPRGTFFLAIILELIKPLSVKIKRVRLCKSAYEKAMPFTPVAASSLHSRDALPHETDLLSRIFKTMTIALGIFTILLYMFVWLGRHFERRRIGNATQNNGDTSANSGPTHSLSPLIS